MFGLARPYSLHRHAERIQAHVGHGLAFFSRRRPFRLRLRRLDHPTFFAAVRFTFSFQVNGRLSMPMSCTWKSV